MSVYPTEVMSVPRSEHDPSCNYRRLPPASAEVAKKQHTPNKERHTAQDSTITRSINITVTLERISMNVTSAYADGNHSMCLSMQSLTNTSQGLTRQFNFECHTEQVSAKKNSR